jgi:hypothetical protein
VEVQPRGRSAPSCSNKSASTGAEQSRAAQARPAELAKHLRGSRGGRARRKRRLRFRRLRARLPGPPALDARHRRRPAPKFDVSLVLWRVSVSHVSPCLRQQVLVLRLNPPRTGHGEDVLVRAHPLRRARLRSLRRIPGRARAGPPGYAPVKAFEQTAQARANVDAALSHPGGRRFESG